ncbi:U1 small nuclear ribonucleoprotein C [Nesidiocoris tenuis]|uniref:U1 small nuclear ribonucleoprotein C n=1 Tax=Nesidiocoris tenuis TaxID=355587 RepID=A0ABN7B2G0_9HEMI|nr:U1 small nuclear ribonucleoprotein C [Nesidiocoris tenuis]
MDRRKIDMYFGQRHSGMETKLYKAFMKSLETPVPKVDQSAPALAVAHYYNLATMAAERSKLARIEMENRLTLRIINETYRTRGKVDTSMPSMSRSTNFYERSFKNKYIEKVNMKLHHMIQNSKPCVMTKAAMDEDFKRSLKTMIFQAHYKQYYSNLIPELELWDICPSATESRTCCDMSKRVQCYLDIGIDDPKTPKLIKLGRLYLELYNDFAPVAANNFLRFVKGYQGRSYKGTQFFRIQQGIGCIGGDVISDDGGGYFGIDNKCFPDENHLLLFNGPGVLSTFTLFPGHNHSHFFISFKKLEPMNGKFVVFGRVVKTLITLERIEACGTRSGSPKYKVIISNCGDVEQAVANLPQPTGPFALGNSGLLSQECSQERQAMYSQLVRSYKWTDKIHEYSSLAAQLLGQNQLKRSYIVTGSNKRRRAQASCHNVPMQTVDQVISAIDRQFPDMNISVSRPFITNAVMQVTLGKVLQAVVAFKGLMIEWVVIKGHGETLDLWTESRHKVFRKITENSHAAMLHFSSPTLPELAVRSFMTWLHSYITLFSDPCKRCGNHLHNALPPTWRDFRTLEAHHEECKV